MTTLKKYNELEAEWQIRINDSINMSQTYNWPKVSEPIEQSWTKWLLMRVRKEENNIYYVHPTPLGEEKLEISNELLQELKSIFEECYKAQAKLSKSKKKAKELDRLDKKLHNYLNKLK